MHRAMLLFASLAFTLSAVGLGALAPSTPTALAQPPICISLPAGDHQFTAPARDREGEVTFQVTVGEGGVVTGFTEPGGQPIPPAAMLDIFTGDDAYPLPEGVAFVECGGQGDMVEQTAGGGVCVSLAAGSYEETVSAGGRSYEITINVAERGILSDVMIMGQAYGPSEAIALLEGFGAALPDSVQIVDCPAHGGSATPTAYANTGTGGLADSNAQGGSGIWYGIGAFAALAFAAAAAACRRRAAVEAARRV